MSMRPDTLTQPAPSPTVSTNDFPSPFRLAFAADMSSVRETLEILKPRLLGFGLSTDAMENAEIVLAEVLNNIVEHAYRDTDTGRIEIEIERLRARLVCTVSDSGHPMPKGQLPEKRQVPISSERAELPEGGFGWFLIHELVEELSYVRKDSKNFVRIGLALT